jgi:hypothetical protein
MGHRFQFVHRIKKYALNSKSSVFRQEGKLDTHKDCLRTRSPLMGQIMTAHNEGEFIKSIAIVRTFKFKSHFYEDTPVIHPISIVHWMGEICLLTLLVDWDPVSLRNHTSKHTCYSMWSVVEHMWMMRCSERGQIRSVRSNVFWDVTPCSLVGAGWLFRGSYCLHFRVEEYKVK